MKVKLKLDFSFLSFIMDLTEHSKKTCSARAYLTHVYSFLWYNTVLDGY